MSIKGYDNWKLASADDYIKEVGKCWQCKEEIYEGEGVLDIDGDVIHEDCFYDYAWRVLSPRRIDAGYDD